MDLIWKFTIRKSSKESYRGIMAKVIKCILEVSEFKLKSCYYVHFRTKSLGK